jgi:hypothetical protein
MTRFPGLLMAAFLALPGPGIAQSLPLPSDAGILVISGGVSVTNDAGTARLDLAMIDALPQRETVTLTPWFEGPQRFSGPLLSDLMDAVGASGSELRFVAINDYATSIPWEDLQRYPVILASRHNGQTMSVRQKGPLFVIYPFDEFPELRNELYFSRSAWQVAAIEVIP